MTIRVRVLNGYTKSIPKTLKKEPVILTPEYVRRLNEQIAYNILKNQINSQPDVFTLRKTIKR